MAKLFHVILIFLVVIVAAAATVRADDSVVPTAQVKVETAPATGGASVQLRFADDTKLGVRTLAVENAALKSVVAQLLPGDQLVVTTDSATDPKKLLSASPSYQSVPMFWAIGAVVISLVFLYYFLYALMRSSPLELIRGVDGRFSKSQAQMGLWFFALLSVYLGAVGLRAVYLGGGFIGGVEIPTNLLLLSGLSAFSYGAARAVTATKTDKDPNAKGPQTTADEAKKVEPGKPEENKKVVEPQPVATTPSRVVAQYRDLFQNDKGEFDLGDTQMLLITLIVVVLFVADGMVFLQNLAMQGKTLLPDVDSTLLSAFGLGQGAYLFKKAAGKPGES